MSEILAPVSFGELLDNIAILQIKAERMKDPEKVANVRKELDALSATWLQHPAAQQQIPELRADLKAVNERLWEIEDAIRACERDHDFGPTFVELARSVYKTNDRRAALKRRVNELLGSRLIEEKGYTSYGP